MPELVYLKKFVDLLDYRRKYDYDNFIVVSGIKGTGKSTALYWLGKEYMRKLGREFDLTKHVIYSDDFNEIFSKIKEAKDGDYIWFDEGGRIILAEDWNSANSKKLKKMFSEIRTKHLCIGFAVPFAFTRIDAKYREALINFWIWVPIRGMAIVFEPIVHPTIGGFLEKEVEQKVRYISWSESMSKSYETRLLDNLKSIPSFLGSFKYPDMPKKDREVYLSMRDKAVFNITSPEELKEVEEKALVKYIDRLRYDDGLKIQEIAMMLAPELNITPQALINKYYKLRKKHIL